MRDYGNYTKMDSLAVGTKFFVKNGHWGGGRLSRRVVRRC